MNDLARQRRYWDAAAESALFTHPLDVELLRRHVPSTGRILDYGCGYGRILEQLHESGYRNIVGVDTSEAMASRARRNVPDATIAVSGELPISFGDTEFDAILFFAVFTCVPDDDGQRALIAEARRLLAPGGIVYISDFLLHSDLRNRERYRANEARFGKHGVFEIDGGLAVRHHSSEWIRELCEPLDTLLFEPFEATTMHANEATGFRFVGRTPAGERPRASVPLVADREVESIDHTAEKVS